MFFRTPAGGPSRQTVSQICSAAELLASAPTGSRKQADNHAEPSGSSGGLTVKATRALLKKSEIKAILADPGNTPDKLVQVLQAQEEAGILFSIPYSQPATLSVATDGLCGLHALGQHARLVMLEQTMEVTTYQQPIVELIQALPPQQKQTRNEAAMNAYSTFLNATTALHDSSSAAEQQRIRQLLGEQYEAARSDVQRLHQTVNDPRYRKTGSIIGSEHWQKGYVLSFLSAVNHLPIEIYGSYLENSGRLELRRLRLEQRYADSSPTLDVPLTTKQLKDLLQRNTGGVGLVDNHFYIIGPLPRMSLALPLALRHLAEQIIQAEEMNTSQKRRRKLGSPQVDLFQVEFAEETVTLKPIPHSDLDATRHGLAVRKSLVGKGRGLFTTNRIAANQKITSMPGLALTREQQHLIAIAKTGVDRFQNVLSSWNGRAVDPGGMEKYHYYGHLANTALDPGHCNAEYRWASTEEYPNIYSTCNIGAGAEVVVSYGSREQTALFFMHPERLVHLQPAEQQQLIDEYQEEIMAAGYEFPEGMKPLKPPGSRKRAEESTRRQMWREIEGMQHGTRHVRKHI